MFAGGVCSPLGSPLPLAGNLAARTSTRRAVLPFRLLFYSVKLICVLNWMPGVLACSFLTLASSLMAWR